MKLKASFLFLFLLTCYACKKETGTPADIKEQATINSTGSTPSNTNSTDQVYYLNKIITGSTYSMTVYPKKDSLLLKNSVSTSVEISIRIARSIPAFLDVVGNYKSSGGTIHLTTTDTLPGITYAPNPYYSQYSPYPTYNILNNFRINGDTLTLNLNYTYLYFSSGKTASTNLNYDLVFVKAK